jgi:hypothetical protein
MHRTQHRVALTFAAGLAALAVGATPALAGSDGCDEDGCQAERSPAPVVPVTPQPQTVVPVPQPMSTGDSAPQTSPKSADRTRHVVRGTHTITVAQRTVNMPTGAVSAGAGGTAPHGPGGILAGLGGAGIVLLVAGGGLVAATRPTRS